jgi:putative transposase
MSVRRQCELLGLSRSSLYYEPAGETPENLRLMRLIDEQYTARPFYGSRRMTEWLTRRGEEVNRKRVRRLMRLMGLEAIYPRPRTSMAGKGHRVYPYLLRGVSIERADQVWSSDITYVPMATGFMYLAAVIDWFSRYVVSWRLSNTLDGSFCPEMLGEALRSGKPEVFNTDQGVQFTAEWVRSKIDVGPGRSLLRQRPGTPADSPSTRTGTIAPVCSSRPAGSAPPPHPPPSTSSPSRTAAA